MAAGFKTATINAASVPSTQTDFPAFVDLSRLGITTLAEAQSVRVYADSGKTTQWAREIVSATEMHVKVPSLTSTVAIYVDWDGVSADYAVTDTYGRNAVWTGYRAVYHYETLTTDYSGGGYTLTNNGTVTTSANGLAGGNSADFGSANSTKYFSSSTEYGITATGNITISLRVKMQTEITTGEQTFIQRSVISASGSSIMITYQYNGGTRRLRFLRYGSTNSLDYYTITMGTTNWYNIAVTFNNTNLVGFVNGVQVTTSSQSGTQSIGGTAMVIGAGSGITLYSSTFIEETRLTTSILTADWQLTQYNNENAESTFWGTWSNAGASFTPTPMLQMMQRAGGIV